MYTQLQFETTRFRRFHYERLYDAHLKPGEDVADWLRAHLKASGYQVSYPRQSGEVWVIEITRRKTRYLMGVRDKPISDPESINDALWCMVLEKQRSWLQRLLLLNKLKPDDPLCSHLYKLLNEQMDFHNVCTSHSLVAP